MIKSILGEYYGDHLRYFYGIVVDANDSVEKLGRVKVRIFGIHDATIPPSDLPWANVVVPVTQTGVSGGISPTGLMEGAMVFGFFLDGEHSQIPLVIGSVPRKEGMGNVVEIPQAQSPNNPDINQTSFILPPNPVPSWSTPLVEGSNAEKAFVFLKQYYEAKGNSYAAQIAAGFVGNFINESGPNLDPSIVGDNGQSFGIAQWNYGSGRYTRRGAGPIGLVEFAASKGKTWDDLQTQLEFVTWELENTMVSASSKISNGRTVARSAELVMLYYEIPQVAADWLAINGTNSTISRSSTSRVERAYQRERDERVSDSLAVYRAYGEGEQ